jgi:hypothetical protein
MSIEICCNICRHNYCEYHFDEFDTDNIYVFLYIRQEFHLFLVIYRWYGNFLNRD